MRTLVIECATEACSVALFEDGACLASDHRILGRGHAEQLVPMIAGLPDRGRAERIAVSRGPGSFTGVRIGIAAARACGVAWNSQVVGYPTLALVAAMALEQTPSSAVRVVMTGGHGEWFVQDFQANGTASKGHASLSPGAAAALAPVELIAGTKAKSYVELTGTGTAVEMHPNASAFRALSPAHLSENVSAFYGRPPDAKVPTNG